MHTWTVNMSRAFKAAKPKPVTYCTTADVEQASGEAGVQVYSTTGSNRQLLVAA